MVPCGIDLSSRFAIFTLHILPCTASTIAKTALPLSSEQSSCSQANSNASALVSKLRDSATFSPVTSNRGAKGYRSTPAHATWGATRPPTTLGHTHWVSHWLRYSGARTALLSQALTRQSSKWPQD